MQPLNDALSHARRLIEEAWQNADGWLDRQVEARVVLEAAVAADPSNAALLTAYGTVLCDLHEYALAAQVLERSIRLDPEDSNAYFSLAVVAFNHPVPANRPGALRRPRTLFRKSSSLTSSPLTWPAYFDFHAQ